MDLRNSVKSPDQVTRAKRPGMRGLLNYQPFIFADDFACGAGLSITQGFKKTPPSMWFPGADPSWASPEYLAQAVAEPGDKEAFFSANNAMRSFYDNLIRQIADAMGELTGKTVVDVGCNTGYFPISLARLGADACGIDRVDYSDSIALLNEICGTCISFKPWSYDGKLVADRTYDLVLSMAMICHLSDPLQHLAWLGSSAKEALFVFTPCHHDDDYSIRFHEANRYYVGDNFPYCFDATTISRKLLRLSFEKLGFSKVLDLDTSPMPPAWQRSHLALLGVRTDSHRPAQRPVIS